MINQFVQHVRRYGVSRTNRFQVTIPFPSALINKINSSGSGSFLNQLDPTGLVSTVTDALGVTSGRGALAQSRQLSMVCIGAQFPGWSATQTDVPWQGFHDKIVTDSNSDDVEFLFLVSGDGVEQQVFDMWTDLIQSHKTGKLGYYDDYITDMIRIESKDAAYDRQHYIDLAECYPTSVNPIQMDKTADASYNILAVTFAFKRIRPRGSMDLMETFQESTLGSIIEDVSTGNFTGAAEKAIDVVNDVANGAYVGEALGMYDMVKEVTDRSGIDPKHTKKILRNMKGDVDVNPRISNSDKSSLKGLIDTINLKL